MSTVSKTKQGLNQLVTIVKGVAGRSQSLPGIAVGDKIVSASRVTFGATVGNISIAVLTATKFSVSAANTIYKSGTPASFPGKDILIVNWVDRDGNVPDKTS